MRLLRRASLTAFVSIWLILLSACVGGEAREWLDAPGWSHGLPLAETRIGDPVAMALDNGGGIYLLFVTAVNSQLSPQVVALNRQAERVWEQTLPAALSQPDKPLLIWDGQALNLFWMASNSLYQAQVDTAGNIVMEPRQLSRETVVDAFDVALNPQGLLTLWYAGQRRDPGLYALFDGNLAGEPVLVDAEGVRPSIQYDGQGNLHASWIHYPAGYSDTTFFYAVYEGGVYEGGRETAVHEPLLKPADILTGPWLGLETQQVYIVWNITVRTGPESGKIVTEYLSFPPDQPEMASEPKVVVVPVVADLAYEYNPDGGWAVGERVWPIEDYAGTTAVTDAALIAANQPASELALAFDALVQHEFRKERGQIGIIYLQNGAVNGYQLLTFSPIASVMPAVVGDADGQLYLTWLERADSGGFQIYFASTAPDIVAALSDVTMGDFSRILREASFGLLSGAVLSPILVGLWLLVPMIVLYVTSFLRRGQPGKRVMVGTVLSLLVAGVVYWLAKLLTIPGMWSYVPFSAWVPGLPAWLHLPLQVGVPVLITLLGVAVAWYFTYRRNSESILNFLFIFAAVDGLLTMAVYGFQFYNVI